MQFNFFQWVREGVRQSVLAGVSDAMEQIGTPDSNMVLHPELQKALPPRGPVVAEATRVSSNPKRRLGKSLKEITPAPSPAKPNPNKNG